MDTDKVLKALNSQLRREILKIISDEPMNVMLVLKELNNKGLKVKYRETIYRALEKLVDSGLVEKFYNREKGLCYKLKAKTIKIDLTKGEIEIH